MPFTSVPAGGTPAVEIDPETATLTWWPVDEHGQADQIHRVPWFPSVGVLDYASARSRTAVSAGLTVVPTTRWPAPAFGDPLIVRPELAAVFWRTHNLLCTAPVGEGGRIDFAAAEPVDWSTDHGAFVLIEHNLAECGPLRTLAPRLQVVRVDGNGRLSFALLVAAADGSPVIGPAAHQHQPHVPFDTLTADRADLAEFAAMWDTQLRESQTWQLLAAPDALEALAAAGFTTTSPAAQRPGLVSALAAADEQWTTGWYGGTRLLILGRYIPSFVGGDRHYDHHKPGTVRVAVAGGHRDMWDTDLIGWQGPADVETLPPDQTVPVGLGYDSCGMSRPTRAGQCALHEPTLLDGPLPMLDYERWQAACRRCGASMRSPEKGRDWTPYVDELCAEVEGRGPAGLWCPAHPDGGRLRPHAPVGQVADCRVPMARGLPPKEWDVPF